jgi:hypothetical protein
MRAPEGARSLSPAGYSPGMGKADQDIRATGGREPEPAPRGHPTAAEHDAALVRIRAQLRQIRSAVDAVERELPQLTDRPVQSRPRPERHYELLIDVYERGPHGADPPEFDELARRHDYDRRGLNGFFKGSRASLRQDRGRVTLTAEGVRLVLERLTVRSRP